MYYRIWITGFSLKIHEIKIRTVFLSLWWLILMLYQWWVLSAVSAFLIIEKQEEKGKQILRPHQAVTKPQSLCCYAASLEYFPRWLSCAFFPPSQCALAADEVVFNQKDLEVKELKSQVQMMVQENKGHVVSLKEAQKVNRLQVELMYLALCISLEQYLTKIAL